MPEEQPTTDASTVLEERTVPELREIAAERGVDLTGLKAKADIVAAIEAGPSTDDSDDQDDPPAPPAPTTTEEVVATSKGKAEPGTKQTRRTARRTVKGGNFVAGRDEDGNPVVRPIKGAKRFRVTYVGDRPCEAGGFRWRPEHRDFNTGKPTGKFRANKQTRVFLVQEEAEAFADITLGDLRLRKPSEDGASKKAFKVEAE